MARQLILFLPSSLEKQGKIKYVLGQHIKEFLPNDQELLSYLSEVSDNLIQDMVKRFVI